MCNARIAVKYEDTTCSGPPGVGFVYTLMLVLQKPTSVTERGRIRYLTFITPTTLYMCLRFSLVTCCVHLSVLRLPGRIINVVAFNFKILTCLY